MTTLSQFEKLPFVVVTLLIVLVCLILNAFLAAAEMAFVSVGKAQLRILAQRGVKRAQMLLDLKSNPERILSVIQIGITLVGAVAAAVSGAGAEESLSPFLAQALRVDEQTADAISIAIIVLPLTYLSVVFGELIPKSISLSRPTRIALVAAFWLQLFDRIFSPVVSLLESSTKFFMGQFGLKPEEELVQSDEYVDIAQLKSQTRQYVLNTITAERKRAQDVMIPWASVNFVEKADSLAKVKEVVLQSGHTRLPVYDNQNVIGLIHTKEFMSLVEGGGQDWMAQIRPILKFRAGEPILNILPKMQESRSHMAAVYDRMTVIGVLTLEDIIEEIVGDLFDEDDDGKVRRFYGRMKR